MAVRVITYKKMYPDGIIEEKKFTPGLIYVKKEYFDKGYPNGIRFFHAKEAIDGWNMNFGQRGLKFKIGKIVNSKD